MELSDLRVFRAVVETGGISRAAERLHRVPSNITARIQKLELDVGKSLFIREKNRLRISPAGEQLFTYAESILALADEALEQLHDDRPTGGLSIGSIEALAATRLSKLLMQYHREYPQVTLALNTHPTGVLIEQVLAGQLDVAFVSDPINDARLAITPVFKESLILVSSLGQPDIRSPSDLAQNPTLLGFSAQCTYRRRLADWVKDAEVAANVIEINSYHALLNCVTAGMGVGLVPESLLALYPFKADIKSHVFPSDIAQSMTCIIWRKDALKPSLTAFYQLLMKGMNET